MRGYDHRRPEDGGGRGGPLTGERERTAALLSRHPRSADEQHRHLNRPDPPTNLRHHPHRRVVTADYTVGRGRMPTTSRGPPAHPRHQRILDTAWGLVGHSGAGGAVDRRDRRPGLAEVSRATRYRMYATNSVLFDALVQHFSPWQPISDLLVAAPDRHPTSSSR
jgi:hypothetical protein